MGTREGSRRSYVPRASEKRSCRRRGGRVYPGSRPARRPTPARRLGGHPTTTFGRDRAPWFDQRERGQHERQHAPRVRAEGARGRHRPRGRRARAETSGHGARGGSPSRRTRAPIVGHETRRSENRHPMELGTPRGRLNAPSVRAGPRGDGRGGVRIGGVRCGASRGVAPFSSRSESRRASRVGAPRRWRVVLVVVPQTSPRLPGRADRRAVRARCVPRSSTSTPRARATRVRRRGTRRVPIDLRPPARTGCSPPGNPPPLVPGRASPPSPSRGKLTARAWTSGSGPARDPPPRAPPTARDPTRLPQPPPPTRTTRPPARHSSIPAATAASPSPTTPSGRARASRRRRSSPTSEGSTTPPSPRDAHSRNETTSRRNENSWTSRLRDATADAHRARAASRTARRRRRGGRGFGPAVHATSGRASPRGRRPGLGSLHGTLSGIYVEQRWRSWWQASGRSPARAPRVARLVTLAGPMICAAPRPNLRAASSTGGGGRRWLRRAAARARPRAAPLI